MIATRRLILLGFVSQGLASANLLLLAFFVGIWLLGDRLRRDRRVIGQEFEALLLLFLLPASYIVAKKTEIPVFVALGYPLLALQFLRLLRPNEQREALFSLLIAMTHVAIGSLAIFDYKFGLLFAGAVALLPRAFFELEAMRYETATRERPKTGDNREKRRGQAPKEAATTWDWDRAEENAPLGLMPWLFAVAFTLLFFVLCPRAEFRGGGLSMGLVSPMLDAARGGQRSGNRPLFEIEGEEIGYLATHRLDQFNGDTWRPSVEGLERKRWMPTEPPAGMKLRTVRILDLDAVRLQVPIDGLAAAIQGDYFERVKLLRQGSYKIAAVLNPERPEYRYWVNSTPNPEPLTRAERRRLIDLPWRSKRLLDWIDRGTGNATDPETVAKKLEERLYRNFTYELGAPDLSRLNPVEEFIFEVQTGHCERFASALATLLRLKSIPARVVLGYLPTEESRRGEGYRITPRQGHAWVEAYLEKKGWVTFDATPYGEEIRGAPKSLYTNLYDWVVDSWYQYVVFYRSEEHKQVLGSIFTLAKWSLAALGAGLYPLLLAFLALGTGILFQRLGRGIPNWRWSRKKPTSTARERISHFYGRLLHELARWGYRLRPSQTPLELLAELQRTGFPLVGEARLVTHAFCDARYGEIRLSPADLHAVQEALGRVTRYRRPPGGAQDLGSLMARGARMANSGRRTAPDESGTQQKENSSRRK